MRGGGEDEKGGGEGTEKYFDWLVDQGKCH